MKNQNVIFSLIMVIFLTTFSCGIVSIEEKAPGITFSESFPPDLTSFNTILTNGSNRTWNVTGFSFGESTNFQNCRLDDSLILKNDGTYDYNGGNELCGAEDNSQFKTGIWEADFDSRTIYFDKGTGNEIEIFIESCQESKVVFSSKYFGMKVLGQFES